MLPPTTFVARATLRVADLDAVLPFYEEVLGLSVRERGSDWIALGTAERLLVRLVQLRNGRSDPAAPGLYHIALRLPTRRALGGWLAHFAALGGPHWQGAADHGVSEAFYLADPEGNGIEMYWDRPADAWPRAADGALQMTTDPLDLVELLEAADAQPAATLPAGTDLGHVHLQVSDLTAAHRFYVEQIGFVLQARYGAQALFVSAGGYHHHVGLNTWRTRGAPPRTADLYGLERITFGLPTAEALAALGDRLARNGTAVQWETPHCLTVIDPAGSLLAFETGSAPA